MSQSSVEEQIKDLQSAGFPVRRGTRIDPKDHTDTTKNKPEFGSQLWLSRWSRNVFRNYPIVSKAFGARFLHEACHAMPCFVVGVAPSLDGQIAELKAAKNRAVIISTDAALRALLANGITPDLVISYDCQDEQKRLWETVKEAPPCLFNSCTHPDSIASWPGPVLFYNQFHTQDELCKSILPNVLPELGQIPSGGTVGNMAVLAAHLMGCNPICLVGMDFCYAPVESIQGRAPSWRYRAQDYRFVEKDQPDPGQSAVALGTPARWVKTEIKELYDNDERMSRSFIVKGDNGKEYRSDPELVFYLESFKELIPAFNVPVVNCSPDGLIPSTLLYDRDGIKVMVGIEKMTASEAIGKYCVKEFQGGRSVLKHLANIIPDPRKS